MCNALNYFVWGTALNEDSVGELGSKVTEYNENYINSQLPLKVP